jgi:hypothetical protein
MPVPVDPNMMLAALRGGDLDPFQQAAYVERNNSLPELGANGIGTSAGGPLRAAPDYSNKFTPKTSGTMWKESTNPAAQTYPSEMTYNAGRNVALGTGQTTPSALQNAMTQQNTPLTYQQTIQLLRVLEKRGIVGPVGEGGAYPTLVGKNKVR